MRLVNADELKREMYRKCIDTDEEIDKGRAKWDSGLWIRYKVFEDAINLAPGVDAEPIRHGKWVRIDEFTIKCSMCNQGGIFASDWEYCPLCGAKMDL